MAELIDALGIPLAEHRRWLPDRVALWPTPPKIVDKTAAIEWKRGFVFRREARCWWCGAVHSWDCALEAHHMARIGHHDAPWNFALLCADCHRHDGEAVTASALPRLLRLKHQYDREHTSWVHLAVAMGRFLPMED